MIRLAPFSFVASMLAANVLLGCGDDDPVGHPPSGVPLPDAGDTPAPDAGADGSDAGTSDAGADAGGGELGPLSDCDVEGDVLEVPIVSAGDGGGFSALRVGNSLHVVYVAQTCGGVDHVTGTGLVYQRFESTGPFDAPIDLVNRSPDQCWQTRSPALTLRDQDQLDVYYTANNPGSFELHRQDVGLVHRPERLTEDQPGALDIESATTAQLFGDGVLLAYANQTPATDGPGQIVTRRPDVAENEVGALSAGFHPTRIALNAFGEEASSGAVGWVSDSDAARGIWLQPLDAAGKPSDEATQLSAQVGGWSNLDIASRDEGGAVVYAVATAAPHELRFRALDAEALPIGGEIKLTSANRFASGVSIAPFADGYVAAFRMKRAGGASVIQLMFITKGGEIGGERGLHEAAASGGDTRVLVTSDGRISVVWTDDLETGAVLRAVRATCSR